MSSNTKMQFSDGVEEIVSQVTNPDIKVVSFDVFDTLLLRPVLTPVDIFRLLENKIKVPNFHNMRVAAEAEARKAKSFYVQDVTLDEIYDSYERMFHCSKEEAEKLKSEELQIEYTLLYERKTAKYIFEKAKEANKKIIIISDMYLSSEFINQCLKKNGYKGYDHIYVSSETGVLKSTGLMYKYVLEELELEEIKPSEIIHIGDNKRSDVDMATSWNINSVFLMKPVEKKKQLKKIKRLDGYILPDMLNSNNTMLYGVMLNLLFDDPYVSWDIDTYTNGDYKNLGYWFAPYFLGFTKWFVEKIRKYEIEYLLLIWRDGFLIEQLLNEVEPILVYNLPPRKKIYLGRQVRLPYMKFEENGFFNSFMEYPYNPKCTVKDFIKNRVLCEDQKQYTEIVNIFLENGYLSENSEIGKFEKYRGILSDLEPFFIKNAEKKCALSSRYIKSVLMKDKKTAVFDRSQRGKSTVFLEDYFELKSVFLTTEVYDVPKAKLTLNYARDTILESYIEYGRYYFDKMGRIGGLIFEVILSDTEAGIKDFQLNTMGDIQLIFNNIEKTDRQKEVNNRIREIQGGIIEYTRKIVRIFQNYFNDLVLDKHGLFDCTIDIFSIPGLKDAKLIANLSPSQSLLAPATEDVLINWYNNKVGKKNVILKKSDTLWDKIRTKGYLTADKMGILPQAQKVYHMFKGDWKNQNSIIKRIQSETDEKINLLQEENFGMVNTLLMGSIPQNLSGFFNQLNRKCNLHICFIASGFIKIPTCFEFPCIAGPFYFSLGGFDRQNENIKPPQHIKDEVDKRSVLQKLEKRLILKGYSKGVACLMAYEIYRYYAEVFKKISPKFIMVWNHWGINSVVPRDIAEHIGIPVLSLERGFVEGTIMASWCGYGLDIVNTKPTMFREMEVSLCELEHAKKVCHFLEDSSVNRYKQPQNNKLVTIKEKLEGKEKNILIVGSFDIENPAFPLDENTRELYSPIFGESIEMVQYISKIAKKYKWNIIYKPHPLMDKINPKVSTIARKYGAMYVKDVDIYELINIVDVVVCMVSSVSYISLIRGKPVVSLAYTTLREKGCCYEVNKIDEIEKVIDVAINHGMTEEQHNNFIKHVAQINKYYYYDDLSVRPIRYGRQMEQLVSDITNKINEVEK